MEKLLEYSVVFEKVFGEVERRLNVKFQEAYETLAASTISDVTHAEKV